MRDELPRWVPPIGLAAIALAWLSTVSPYVQGGDNPELATLFAQWGVAHPPGYPVYTLYLRALSFLPASSPAHGAAIATALLGLAAVAVLYKAVRAWGASAWSALLATTLFATATLPWSLSTAAEVFALNTLVAALVLWFGAPFAPLTPALRCVALGAVAGVGLGNHLSCVALAPVGLYALAREARESGRPARSVGLALLAAVPGVASYLALVAVARLGGDLMRWGDTATLGGLVHHALRRDYGTLSLSASAHPPMPGPHLAALASGLWSESRGVGVVLALVGLSTALAGRSRRAHTAALLGALLLAGPCLVARFNVPLTGLGPAVVSRFYLLPLTLLVVPVAMGFDRVVHNVALDPRLRLLLVAAFAAVGIGLSRPEVQAAHAPDVEHYLLDTVESLPPRAVLLATGDEVTLGTRYTRHALGLRADVVTVNPSLLHLAHYRARTSAQLGVALPAPRDGSVDSVALARALLGTGRPLFLADLFTNNIVYALPTYPLGTLIRVLPDGTPPPPLREVLAENEARFQGFRMRPTTGTAAPWQAVARERYARNWFALGAAARAQGQPAVAALCYRRALGYAPWLQR